MLIFAPIAWTPLLVISVIALIAMWLWGELVSRPREEARMREMRRSYRAFKRNDNWGPGR